MAGYSRLELLFCKNASNYGIWEYIVEYKHTEHVEYIATTLQYKYIETTSKQEQKERDSTVNHFSDYLESTVETKVSSAYASPRMSIQKFSVSPLGTFSPEVSGSLRRESVEIV